MNVLIRIKQLVLRRQVIITAKAEIEMIADDLTEDEVYESIINAQRIAKTIRSTSTRRRRRTEKLYVIKDRDLERFCVLISSKRAI